ncbi:ABC transporter permease [Brevibacillus fluminis]|nr:ABC transporter permease [Brevibacillus fluminis]
METIRPRSALSKNMRLFRKDIAGVLALVVILLFLLAALFAHQLAPYPEQGKGESNITNTLSAPSSENLFGTDRQGRDILSRCLFGLQTSLFAALFVTFLAFAIGVPLGAIAGFFGGVLDEIIMRITDIFLSFPALLLAIALVAVLGPSLENAILALAVSWWPWYARIARSSTISLKNSLFIDAARVMGVSKMTIIFRHIVPNILTPIIVQVSVDMGTVILATASLSFLGLGSQPPTADLGQMVSEGRGYILNQWWYSTFPGLLVLLLVMAFNILGDALQDLLDPKSKGRST